MVREETEHIGNYNKCLIGYDNLLKQEYCFDGVCSYMRLSRLSTLSRMPGKLTANFDENRQNFKLSLCKYQPSSTKSYLTFKVIGLVFHYNGEHFGKYRIMVICFWQRFSSSFRIGMSMSWILPEVGSNQSRYCVFFEHYSALWFLHNGITTKHIRGCLLGGVTERAENTYIIQM